MDVVTLEKGPQAGDPDGKTRLRSQYAEENNRVKYSEYRKAMELHIELLHEVQLEVRERYKVVRAIETLLRQKQKDKSQPPELVVSAVSSHKHGSRLPSFDSCDPVTTGRSVPTSSTGYRPTRDDGHRVSSQLEASRNDRRSRVIKDKAAGTKCRKQRRQMVKAPRDLFHRNYQNASSILEANDISASLNTLHPERSIPSWILPTLLPNEEFPRINLTTTTASKTPPPYGHQTLSTSLPQPTTSVSFSCTPSEMPLGTVYQYARASLDNNTVHHPDTFLDGTGFLTTNRYSSVCPTAFPMPLSLPAGIVIGLPSGTEEAIVQSHLLSFPNTQSP